MGSLTEAIYGYRGSRPVYNWNSPKFNPKTGGLKAGIGNSDYIKVEGIDVVDGMLGQLMTTDPELVTYIRKVIRQATKQARMRLSKDARSYMKSDPRKASRAIKFSVYKSIFGSNLSILQKRGGSAGAKFFLERQRKTELNPHMRGGNRRQRDMEASRLDYYYGADRGFILRFLSSGTVFRTSRYGNRGSIRQTNWFGHVAPWQMEAAAEQVANEINEYVKSKTNG